MKLGLDETKFALKQRIDELTKWLGRYPSSPETSRRQIELETAKEQLGFIEKK
jgi:hypothetical protein